MDGPLHRLFFPEDENFNGLGHDDAYLYILSTCCALPMKEGKGVYICEGCADIYKMHEQRWSTKISLNVFEDDRGWSDAIVDWLEGWTGTKDLGVTALL